jgi:hypothetical protein
MQGRRAGGEDIRSILISGSADLGEFAARKVSSPVLERQLA